ncbi:hypothetical protein D5086_020448 [Populus alba]|uniref:Uncharacterized protein n=1 Tax=Populus alba TaxID=43335 RepID=A0ACC4BKH2_POPAL
MYTSRQPCPPKFMRRVESRSVDREQGEAGATRTVDRHSIQHQHPVRPPHTSAATRTPDAILVIDIREKQDNILSVVHHRTAVPGAPPWIVHFIKSLHVAFAGFLHPIGGYHQSEKKCLAKSGVRSLCPSFYGCHIIRGLPNSTLQILNLSQGQKLQDNENGTEFRIQRGLQV